MKLPELSSKFKFVFLFVTVFVAGVQSGNPLPKCLAARFQQSYQIHAADGSAVESTATADLSFSVEKSLQTNIKLESCVINGVPDPGCSIKGTDDRGCKGVGCSFVTNKIKNFLSISNGYDQNVAGASFMSFQGAVYGNGGSILTWDKACNSDFCCIRWSEVQKSQQSEPEDYSKTCKKFHIITKAGNETTEIINAKTEIAVDGVSVNVSRKYINTSDENRFERPYQYGFNDFTIWNIPKNYLLKDLPFDAEFETGGEKSIGSLKLHLALYDPSGKPLHEMALPHGYFEVYDGIIVTAAGQQFTGANQCTRQTYPAETLTKSIPRLTYAVVDMCCVDYGKPLKYDYTLTKSHLNFLMNSYGKKPANYVQKMITWFSVS